MKLTSTTLLMLVSATLLAVPQAAFAQDIEANQPKKKTGDGSIRLNTGISYSSGEYGELEDTEVIAVPFSLTYKNEGFKLRVSVPYVIFNGPGSLLSTPEGRDAFFGDSGGGQGRGRGRGRGGDSDNSGSGSSSSGSGSGGTEVEVEDELEDEILDDDDITDEDGFAALDNKRSGIGDVNVSALYSFQLASGTYSNRRSR